jgi:hypothetical protein
MLTRSEACLVVVPPRFSSYFKPGCWEWLSVRGPELTIGGELQAVSPTLEIVWEAFAPIAAYTTLVAFDGKHSRPICCRPLGVRKLRRLLRSAGWVEKFVVDAPPRFLFTWPPTNPNNIGPKK